jgi:hypothetical protein
MAFSDAQAQGFALAAILNDDRDLGWATAHVDDSLLQRATARLLEVRAAADKRAALAQLVRAVHGQPDPALLLPVTASRSSERTKPALSHAASSELAGVLSRLARRGSSI